MFSTFSATLDVAGLTDLLRSKDASFTIFCPTDEAFRQLGAETLENIIDDPDVLEAILLYHMLSGTYRLDDLQQGPIPSLLTGDDIDVEFQYFLVWLRGSVRLNGEATVERTDIQASNGIIHAIDHVLVPLRLANIVMCIASCFNVYLFGEEMTKPKLAVTNNARL